MSGGRKIDDHKSWMGAPEKGGVFPANAKMKQEKSASDAAHLFNFEDTTEAIKKVQDKNASQAMAYKPKDGYRH